MRTILQVDDDPDDVFLLQHALKKAGVANPIQVATDGQQAIDYLLGAGKFADRAKFPFPSLVLLDLKLPHVMGLEVLRWIRKHLGKPVLVLILTASGSDADITEAYRLGAQAFLTKPSEANKLEDMVKAIKDFWLTHNTLPPECSPESSLEEGVSLIRASTSGFAANPQPTVNGRGRQAWQGNAFFSPPMARPRWNQRRKGDLPAESAAVPALTSRQTQVMQLIADGYSTRQIADRLSISIKTAEKHRQALLDKLDIHNIASLTRYAVSSGVVESHRWPNSPAMAALARRQVSAKTRR